MNFRFTTLSYFTLMETTSIFYFARSLFAVIQTGKLPVRVWLPWSYESSPILFWLWYSYQVIMTMFLSPIISIASETLIASLMMQVCSQLEILKHRISEIPNSLPRLRDRGDLTELQIRRRKLQERTLLANCNFHHVMIYRFII